MVDIDLSYPPLQVWLHGEPIAKVHRDGRLLPVWVYEGSALGDRPDGALLASMSLPVRQAAYSAEECLPFLNGLLPEGTARDRIEAAFRVRRGDVFGLLEAIGRDCAGALMLLDVDDDPDRPPDDEPASLTDKGIAALIAQLPEAPLGADVGRPMSLAGTQDKLLLTELADGHFTLPGPGRPSTHLMKPEPRDAALAGMAANEVWCQLVAQGTDIPSAHAELRLFGDRPAVLVQRFDRLRLGTGIVRVHQEDLTQAAAARDNRKYAYEGGPGLAVAARLLRRYAADPIHELGLLAGHLVVKAVIGDGDWHARNLSFVLEGGHARVAPVYDSLSTSDLTTWSGLGMSVGGIAEAPDLDRSAIRRELESWPMPRRAIDRTVAATLSNLDEALASATAMVPECPPLEEAARRRLERLRDG